MKYILMAMLAFTLAACGGGGGGGGVAGSGEPASVLVAATPPPVATPAPSGAGACTTAYWGDSISALTAPKMALPPILHAVVGGTAQAALAAFLQDPLAEGIIVIEYGTNDANGHTPIEAPLRSMLDHVRAVGRTAVLTGMPHTTTGDLAYHATFDALIRQLAGEYGAVYADWPSVRYDGPSDLMPDGVHPADAYQQRLADALSSKIAGKCGK